jgi:hypothetical protein
MERLGLSDFADAVGAAFSITDDVGGLELTLERADELPAWGPDIAPFRLEFRGPFEPILPQATYTLRRDGATFEIFIVPIARDQAGTQYEAIFN